MYLRMTQTNGVMTTTLKSPTTTKWRILCMTNHPISIAEIRKMGVVAEGGVAAGLCLFLHGTSNSVPGHISCNRQYLIVGDSKYAHSFVPQGTLHLSGPNGPLFSQEKPRHQKVIIPSSPLAKKNIAEDNFKTDKEWNGEGCFQWV